MKHKRDGTGATSESSSQPENPRPIGFCDGTQADLAELQERAESEGASGVQIEKKHLKSGREIWILHGEE